MRLFPIKKAEKPGACCCGKIAREKMTQPSESGIRVLGSGCAKCNALEAAVKEAMAELEIAEEVEHVTDFSRNRRIRRDEYSCAGGGRQSGLLRQGAEKG